MKDMVPYDIQNRAIPSISTVLGKIHERAPNARIVLMGYPRLISFLGWCLGAPYSFNPGEVSFFDQMADLYAAKMLELTQVLDDQYPVVFSDPRNAFTNKAVCGIPEGVHAIVAFKTPGEYPNALISQQSFHPNMIGVGFYRTTFESTLRTMGL
jgi:hypothetical protein